MNGVRAIDSRFSHLIRGALLVWASMFAVTFSMVAQESAANEGSDLEAFQIIFERNIFNPDRAASRRGDPAPEQTPTDSRPVETESLVLLGTISYDKGSFGYFDGTRAEFRGPVGLEQTIAGFQLTQIDSHRVRLESKDRTVDLPVGGQLSKREDEGEWKIVDQRTFFAQSVSSTGRSRLPSSDSSRDRSNRIRVEDSKEAPGDAGGDEDEILKRLMEKREQELSNEK